MTGLPDLNPSLHGLLLDIDGTLLDIAPTPAQVVVPPGLLQDLAILRERLGGALGLISGRSFSEIDRLFPLNLPGAAVHGALCRLMNASVQTQSEPLPADVLHAVEAITANDPGFLVEDKGYAIAVHYRAAMDKRDTLAKALEKIVQTSALPLRLMAGHAVYEILFTSTDKGHALSYLLTQPPFLGRRPVFLGDDITDEPAIMAAKHHGGHGIKIGSESGMTPAQVRDWIHRQALR